MAYDVYQSAALTLRYGFFAAGAFIAARSAFMTIRDGRRAAYLRAKARDAGAIAMITCGAKGRSPSRAKLAHEGVVGSGRGADTRVTHAGLKRRHFFYEIAGGRMRVTALGGARVAVKKGQWLNDITLNPGESFWAGEARFRFLMLTQATEPLSPATRRAYGDKVTAVVRPKRVKVARPAKGDAEAIRKRMSRAYELPLLYAVMAFQFACMFLLAFRDQGVDAFSLRMCAILPLGTYLGLKLLCLAWPIDRAVYILVAFLCSLSVILLRAVFVSNANASDQALFLLAGYVAMFVCAGLVRHVYSWDKLYLFLMPFCLAFMCLPFVFGSKSAAAASWVRLGGVQFQPSELIKPVLIVILASGFSQKRGWKAWWVYAAFGAIMCALLFFQPDLGAMFLYFLVIVVMFYVGTGNKAATLLVLAASFIAVYAFLKLLDRIPAFEYLATRIAIWENPWNSGYENARQIVQGLISIASGGALGSGLGLGSADRVAVVASDYIFAAVSEEFGILFALCVLTVCGVLFARGVSAAMNARLRFHSLIAFGCCFELAAQTLLIVCGNLHLIPLTGVTLPFVSGGGSSLVACMAQAGLILGVSSVNAQDEYDDLMRLSRGEWREQP